MLYRTPRQWHNKILSTVLREGEDTNRVDVVFDVYRDLSIKSAERDLRGESDAGTFKNLVAGQKMKQLTEVS